MTEAQIRAEAKKFAEYWKGKGYEKGDSQPFWLSLLRDILGINNPEKYIKFEDQVKLDHTSFIDGYITDTHVLVEQKSINKDLRQPIKQSNGSSLTPFEQAKRYSNELPYSQRPRWIVTCNFKEFLIYDMENPAGEPSELLLENLDKEYYRLQFLVDSDNTNTQKEVEVSIQACELVGKLYDAILKQYIDKEDAKTLKSLNVLCVRLVFCLYAEDADIFDKHEQFYEYLSDYKTKDIRNALKSLFEILDTKLEDRDPYLQEELAAFPYVNGGLFSDTDVIIPQFTDEIRDILLNKASKGFDWSMISPTIFGALFESTLNPEARRSGGMHYTSIENIHKVIDPLFMDNLKTEFSKIKEIKVNKTRRASLMSFQKKLGALTFFDPACGSGNFLTETYLCLRRLENDILRAYYDGEITFGIEGMNPIQVSIGQFYGIEINDFAVSVAKAALWIAESQMMKETEDVVHMDLDFLPLKSYPNIHEGNALTIDWETVISKNRLNYIMGNPPFAGKKEQTSLQKSELKTVFDNDKCASVLDYVTAWYKKALDYINGTLIKVAYVSTNSITQGEQAAALWPFLLDRYSFNINFAYKTFVWDNEATDKASVYCVIIGFSFNKSYKKLIFHDDNVSDASHINGYLLNAPDIYVNNRKKPICNVPEMNYGSMPIDKGNLIISSEERDEYLKKYPESAGLLKRYMGGEEIINNKIRYCLWLDKIPYNQYKMFPFILERIEKTRQFRLESDRTATKKLADIPQLFGEIRQPLTDYLAIPKVSSEERRYIPITFLNRDIIANGSSLIIPEANLYHFGILTSNIHNAWMRTVAGRLEMRYQYSAGIVYNNFPWPEATENQMNKISEAAKGILDTRSLYSNNSLADLYNTSHMMYPDLLAIHRKLDKLVWEAYGKQWDINSESDCIAYLMKLYQELNETTAS